MTRAKDFFAELERDASFAAAKEELAPAMTLAGNVLRLRARLNLSQAGLARRAGMRQPRIAEIESAKGNPRLATITRLARALGVPVTALFSNTAPQAATEVPAQCVRFTQFVLEADAFLSTAVGFELGDRLRAVTSSPRYGPATRALCADA